MKVVDVDTKPNSDERLSEIVGDLLGAFTITEATLAFSEGADVIKVGDNVFVVGAKESSVGDLDGNDVGIDVGVLNVNVWCKPGIVNNGGYPSGPL